MRRLPKRFYPIALFLPLLTLLGACNEQDKIIHISDTSHLGRLHYKISTPTATYLYDPDAGGFSSIIDPSGADWVAYKDEPWGKYPASAASSFRGLPNLVIGGEDDGAGHPGHQKCQSEIVSENQIRTISLSGKWQWTWTFHKAYAELQIEKADPDRNYWFLYEGPAAGEWVPGQTYWGSNQGGPLEDPHNFYSGETRFDHFEWLYFGTEFSDHTFWVAQPEADETLDLYSLLGNTETGLDSPDGMVVAGFGRGPNTEALLNGPMRFIIGAYPKPITNNADHAEIEAKLRKLVLEHRTP